MIQKSAIFYGIGMYLFVLSACSPQGVSFDRGTIDVAGIPLEVELARTPEQRQQGLMFRDNLPQDQGMLFIFEYDQELSFWMKNTSIPLDIAYISREGEIKEIHPLQPFSEQSVRSRYAVRYALEVNRGFFDQKGILVGDSVDLTAVLSP